MSERMRLATPPQEVRAGSLSLIPVVLLHLQVPEVLDSGPSVAFLLQASLPWKPLEHPHSQFEWQGRRGQNRVGTTLESCRSGFKLTLGLLRQNSCGRL